MKVRVTMGTTYCGCPSEEIEFEYYGSADDFMRDDKVSTDILNEIFNYSFPHYFMDIECLEDEDDDYEEDDWEDDEDED